MRDKQNTNTPGIVSFEVTETRRQLLILYNIYLALSNYFTMATCWFYLPLWDRDFGFHFFTRKLRIWEVQQLAQRLTCRKLRKQSSLIWSWFSHHCTILFLKAGLPSQACSFCFRVGKCCSSGALILNLALHFGITWTALKSTDP